MHTTAPYTCIGFHSGCESAKAYKAATSAWRKILEAEVKKPSEVTDDDCTVAYRGGDIFLYCFDCRRPVSGIDESKWIEEDGYAHHDPIGSCK